MERIMLIEADIRIKAYEIDSLGIVSNIEYIRWFEDLRHLFLDKYYPYDRMVRDKISPVLLKTEAEYKSALTIHDAPRGRLWVTSFGAFKWEMAFEIATEGKIHCLGKQKGCFLDLETQRPAPSPAILLDRFQEELKSLSR
jgi:acyl-CoA thioester hydrolase